MIEADPEYEAKVKAERKKQKRLARKERRRIMRAIMADEIARWKARKIAPEIVGQAERLDGRIAATNGRQRRESQLQEKGRKAEHAAQDASRKRRDAAFWAELRSFAARQR